MNGGSAFKTNAAYNPVEIPVFRFQTLHMSALVFQTIMTGQSSVGHITKGFKPSF